ncbi:MAG: exodeoxyribonuclease VII large subunit [Gemmataceae bacterium]|nr:exodeoxyribonuclease VII large subunit [Gemmata sp.]MDW8197670.1 exodeoxyribonuclease VII large subunit [Gemmataceae bacterium]
MSTATKPSVQPLTVSQLTAQVRGVVEAKFPQVWVVGEVSNFTRASSGHWYFTLKDAQSQIKCAMFRGFNLRMKFDPQDGQEILARGRLTVYDPRGEYQLLVEEIQPKGVGAAELALRRLKEKLLAQGYFDPRRKRPLPRPPRRVALVASATGAAVRDMIEVFAQRWPFTELIVKPARVQGEGAAQDIAVSIRLLNWLHTTGRLPIDVMVLGRGGGSAEDLWAFNEELVAEAIFTSQIPVISAVGHEIDVTIADLVADHRAETPTAAVVALTPHREEMLQQLGEWHQRLTASLQRRLQRWRERLEDFASRPVFRRPQQRISDLEQRLDDIASRLHRAVQVRLNQARQKVLEFSGLLESLSPLQVLARGYSLTHTGDGQLVRDPSGLQPGDVLITTLAHGSIRSLVTETRRNSADVSAADARSPTN